MAERSEREMGFEGLLAVRRPPLTLALGFLTLLVVSIAVTGYQGLTVVRGYLTGMHDDHFVVALSMAEASSNLNAVRASLLGMMAATDRAAQGKLHEQIKALTGEIEASLHGLLGGSASGGFKARIEEIHQVWHAFRDTRDNQLIPAIYAGRLEEARALATGIQAERYRAFSGGAARLIKEAQAAGLRFKREGERRYGSLVALFAGVSGLALCLAVGGALLYGRAIARPLAALAMRSEQRYHDLVQGLHGIVWAADASSGRFFFVSQRAQTILGYPVEQWLAEPDFWSTRLHPDDRERVVGLFRTAAAEGRDYDVEYRMVAADGRIVWLRDRVQAVRDGEGRARQLRGLMVNITERKRVEEALRRSEERYRSVVDNVKQVIFQTDARGAWTFLSAAWADVTGFDVEESLGKSFLHYVHPEDRQRHVELFQPLVRRETEYFGQEFRYLTRAGGIRWVEVYAQLVLSGEGSVAGTFGILTDITERKRAEEERARLSSAVEQAAESIVITNLDGSIVYVNPACERLTGYSRAELIGQNPRIFKSGKLDAEFYRALWATLARGEPWAGCFVNRRKDGSLYEEEAAISPVRDASGRPVNYVAVSRDVTHERQMEAQLRQAQKMEAMGRLAGGVAHDFNNLLTVITGRSELLLGRLGDGNPLARDVDLILKTGHRAAALTRQLLAFSRKQVLVPRVLELNSVVANLEKMLRRLIGEDVELITVPGASLGRVKADPGQIEQVIMNLAVNARDAMPLGGRLTIETANVDLDEAHARAHAGTRPGSYVMLRASDTGCGMDADTVSRIFEPFFTTKGPDRGTGLGLSTVYGIVKQSDGDVSVESELGRGTTFRIYLPRVEEAVSAVEAAPARAGPSRGSETILLVEDEAGVRELAREILRMNGYTVLEAADGGEGLRIGERHAGPIHLLMTDVVMPRMGGRELAQRLARRRPDMRVLYMSGYTDDATLPHGVIEADTAFLQKPFAAGTLARKVREVLDAPRMEKVEATARPA